MTAGETQVLLEVGTLERENGMTLGNRNHARVFCPPGTDRQGAVNYEPAIALIPVTMADDDLQPTTLLIERVAGIEEVAKWMNRLAIGQRNSLYRSQSASGGGECRRTRQDKGAPRLDDSVQPAVPALTDCRRQLGPEQWGRSGVTDDLRALYTVEIGHGPGPVLGRSDGSGSQCLTFGHSGGPDAGLLEPAGTCLRDHTG
jgi:hypothetical protein